MSDPVIPLAEQIRCVRREVAMRRSVYPNRVLTGRMRREASDREISAMEAVLLTLCDLAGEPVQAQADLLT